MIAFFPNLKPGLLLEKNNTHTHIDDEADIFLSL